MKLQKQTVGIIALVGLAIAAIYYFYTKGTAAKESAAVGPPVNANDEATFQKLVSTFRSKCEPKALDWMLPLVTEYMNGIGALTPENLVNGKVTKSGAFAQVYGQSYWPTQYGYKTTADAGEVLSRMFQQFKNQSELGVS